MKLYHCQEYTLWITLDPINFNYCHTSFKGEKYEYLKHVCFDNYMDNYYNYYIVEKQTS